MNAEPVEPNCSCVRETFYDGIIGRDWASDCKVCGGTGMLPELPLDPFDLSSLLKRAESALARLGWRFPTDEERAKWSPLKDDAIVCIRCGGIPIGLEVDSLLRHRLHCTAEPKMEIVVYPEDGSRRKLDKPWRVKDGELEPVPPDEEKTDGGD